MTLRIIEPFAITETNIDSTNVALETAWTAGHLYAWRRAAG